MVEPVIMAGQVKTGTTVLPSLQKNSYCWAMKQWDLPLTPEQNRKPSVAWKCDKLEETHVHFLWKQIWGTVEIYIKKYMAKLVNQPMWTSLGVTIDNKITYSAKRKLCNLAKLVPTLHKDFSPASCCISVTLTLQEQYQKWSRGP